MSDAPTILYIEDNVDSLKLVSRILEADGFAFYGVHDGLSGLEYLESHTPDLILLDINLPNLDGYTVATRLRKRHQLVHTPIIALTANVMQEDQERSMAAGCDGFIEKPIDVDGLPDQIRAYLA